jgi:molybdopterin synthase catalytic subunit
MKLRVLFFASLREIIGSEELEWPWPAEGDTVSVLLDQLYERFPRLSDWDATLLVAADCEYSGRDDHLRPGQEVAVMPPVQGG